MRILAALLVCGHLTEVEAQTAVSSEAATGLFSGSINPLPPPEPAVRPLIGQTYLEDSNLDRIADSLATEVESLRVMASTSQIDGNRDQAQGALASYVNVELIFNRRVTEEQINNFAALGGEITYLYRSVSYGWNGRIPRGQVMAIPQVMGDALVLVNESRPMEHHLDLATRTGRVRPVWVGGFAGSVAGFSGNTNITIAIVDTGVDESHSDLNGRRVYWHDFSSDALTSPVDLIHHGTHVAGIATGSGLAAGAATGTLNYTDSGSLSGVAPGGFFPSPLDLPATSLNFNMTAQWAGGGNTELHLASHVKPGGGWESHGSVSGVSPLSTNISLTGDASRAYTLALEAAGGVSDYVVAAQVSSYPAVGDGFNKLRGVAPGCNWAGAKVFANSGSGNTLWSHAALDDLVATRVANQIKVINMSLGVVGNPGIDATWRQKVNTAVNNGIVVVVSAGNDGQATSPNARLVDDPGRAALALTVGAANDINQLTSYTSQGFTSPGSVAGQEEDYKPDLIAPGGSVGTYTAILSADSNSGDGGAFSDQQASDYLGLQGTSMASPFAAGSAALVIDALQQSGTNWDFNSSQHPRFVKMVLCATATESNADREDDNRNPSLQRTANGPNSYPSGKDRNEGYGMLNPDAAVEAVSTRLAGLTSQTLGPGATDRRAWATRVSLTSGQAFQVNLTVPSTGDFDLYLYSATPSAYGTPVRLASGTLAGSGASETLSYTSSSNTTGLLVVKRVSGSGTFNLIAPMSVAGTVRYYPTNYPPSFPSIKTLSNTMITLTGGTNLSTLTLGDGSFGLAGIAGGGTYGVTPSKTNDSPVANGVSSTDLVIIRRHILGTIPLNSPYKLLAADVNTSGAVNSTDLVLIRRLILGTSNSFPAGLWRHVPAGYVFPDTNSPWNSPINLLHTNLVTGVAGEDFVAIKLGDVNDSWTMPMEPSSPAFGSDRVRAASLHSQVLFRAGNRTVRYGETVTVPISIHEFRDVTSAQFTLSWDPAVLRFTGTSDHHLKGLSAGNFGLSSTHNGKLAFAWDDPQTTGVTEVDGATIFTVRFEVTGNAGDFTALTFDDSMTLREVGVNVEVATFQGESGLISVVDPGRFQVRDTVSHEGTFQLSVPTLEGRRYVLEFTDRLPATNWTALTGVDGDGTILRLVDPGATNRQRFYRVRME